MEEVIKTWAPGGAPRKKEKNYEKKNLIRTSRR